MTNKKIKDLRTEINTRLWYAIEDIDLNSKLEIAVNSMEDLIKEISKEIINEFIQGLRCIHCGDKKESNLTSMCHKCLSEL